jgi:hypothetical protein
MYKLVYYNLYHVSDLMQNCPIFTRNWMNRICTCQICISFSTNWSNIFWIFKLYWDVGSYTSPGAPSICPRSHGFFFARHVTFRQWTLAARHDCNFNIFCATPRGHMLACVTMGYSNIVLRHIFCFNLCISPLLSINKLTVTFNVFLF